MSKDKSRNRTILNRGVLIGIGMTALTFIARTESVISFSQIFNITAIRNFLDIIQPLIFGLLAYGIYWMVMKLYDWKGQQIKRIEAIETEVFNNEGDLKIDQIENYLIIQNKINALTGHGLSELGKSSSLDFIRDKGDSMKGFIKDRNKNFGEVQAHKIIEKYKKSGEVKFHEPN